MMSNLKTNLCKALKAHLTGGKARVPDGGREMLDAFQALSRARSWHQHGPNPISWEAMAAWSQLMRVPIEPHHAEIIMALDNVWLNHAMQRNNAPEGVKKIAPISEQPLSAALFDVAVS
ncbi:hypothetical protein C9E81_08935 [Paracoccus alkanivorans]|uniref:Uncharacterized protein n=2 Tax=Paracoccus alkanivorans TaxID=2116655 RepID=A0A3M0MVK9_9RHOB|nr:hypothetical protein C9E81_08935 [Paracoccus alkanivorans]